MLHRAEDSAFSINERGIAFLSSREEKMGRQGRQERLGRLEGKMRMECAKIFLLSMSLSECNVKSCYV